MVGVPDGIQFYLYEKVENINQKADYCTLQNILFHLLKNVYVKNFKLRLLKCYSCWKCFNFLIFDF